MTGPKDPFRALYDLPLEQVPEQFRSLARSLQESRTRKLTLDDDPVALTHLAARGDLYVRALVLAQTFARIAAELPAQEGDPSSAPASGRLPKAVSPVAALSRRDDMEFVQKAWALSHSGTAKAARLEAMQLVAAVSGVLVNDPEVAKNDPAFFAVLRAWNEERKPGPKGTSKNRWDLLAAWWKQTQGEDVPPERFKKDWIEYKAGVDDE